LIVSFKKAFLKDLEKLNEDDARKIKRIVFDSFPKVTNLSELPNLKKLKGNSPFYRMRVGDYRIGLELRSADQIVFYRVLHRKDIYKYFP
jgi:mRNA interferase RelE/StbE